MSSKESFFFISGTGRSGTSLLQSMLAAHPQVCLPPETHFIRKYLIKYNRINPKLKKTLKNDSNLARLNISEKLNHLIDDAENTTNLYRQIHTVYRQSNKQNLYGDKDPRNIDYIPIINKKLSNSKFIHIIRDPRDVVLSRTRASWSKRSPLFLHAAIYNAQVTRGRKQKNILGDKRYHEIHYESLLAKPKESLGKLCQFLEIPFDEKMLSDFGSAAEKLISQRELQWKKETLGPLLTDNSNKWKKIFSDYQIKMIEGICPFAFSELGYSQYEITKKQSTFQKFKKFIFVIAGRLFNNIYSIRLLLKK